MSSPIPYLGSKISLISKSEIRYEGILYTIDAQDSIIALAKVRSFGTEDRPTEMPVPARDEVYEYIIFRGTDIKKIEVCEAPKQSIPTIHNDPAIVQASQFTGTVRHPLGPIGGGAPGYGYGQTMSQQGLPGAGFAGVAPAAPSAASLASTTQPSELVAAAAATAALAIGEKTGAATAAAPPPPPVAVAAAATGVIQEPIGPPSQHSRQSLPNNSSSSSINLEHRMAAQCIQQLRQQPAAVSHQRQASADVLTGSRSPTPNQLQARKSPVSDAGVQVTPPPAPAAADSGRRKQQRQERDGGQADGGQDHPFSRNNRSYNNNEDRYGRNMRDGPGQMRDGRRNGPPNQGYNQGYNNYGGYNQGYNQGPGYNPGQYRNQYQQNQYFGGGYQGRGGNAGGGMGRGGGGGMGPRGGGGGGRRLRGGMINRGGPGGAGLLYVSSSRQREDKRLFEKDYDFEQANTQFEELRVQLASTKISSPAGSSASTNTLPAGEQAQENGETNGEKERKDDSGTDTGPGDENGAEEAFYDKTKSFFDNISCEAVERSQGRSQRPDWRLERKINQETFGVATARRGNYYNRGRGGYYNRGGGFYRGGYNQGFYRGGGMGGNYRGRGGGRGGNNSNGPVQRNQEANNTGGRAAPPAAAETQSNNHQQPVAAP